MKTQNTKFKQIGRTSRPIKRMIYQYTNGVVFLVRNVADVAKQETAHQEFDYLMNHPELKGVPVLILVEFPELKNSNPIESSQIVLDVADSFNVSKNVQGMVFDFIVQCFLI